VECIAPNANRRHPRGPREVAQVGFTPDGQKLIVADSDGIQAWTLTPLTTWGARLAGNQEPSTVPSLSFAVSPNGGTLAVADGSAGAVLWDLRIDDWRRRLCRILDRDFTTRERAQYLPSDQRSERTCAPR
jgi:hypothetical protein